jgi:hypothetical protein
VGRSSPEALGFSRSFDMLIIRRNQYYAFLQGDPARFTEQIQRHIVETMPDEIRGIPPHLILAMIEAASERARSHGLATDEQIVGFVSVMFEIAPNFDEEPTLRAILSDTRFTPAERWESLFADTPALQAAWERAAQPGFYDEQAWMGPAPKNEMER